MLNGLRGEDFGVTDLEINFYVGYSLDSDPERYIFQRKTRQGKDKLAFQEHFAGLFAVPKRGQFRYNRDLQREQFLLF